MRVFAFRKYLFPHISRLFSARIVSTSSKFMLWIFLMLIFAINVFAKINYAPLYWNQIAIAIKTPLSTESHTTLAKTYWTNGLYSSARSELAYIQTLKQRDAGPTNVLGASSPGELSLWETQTEGIQKNYNVWKRIVSQKTDYRDGYIVLSALAYRQQKRKEAYDYAQQAFRLDPTSSVAQKLLLLTANK